MSHHQFFGWDSFKHCLLFRRSKNIFWSSLQVWSEGHCLNLAKVISPIIWFQQLGRKASVTVCWTEHVLVMSPTFDFGPQSQSSDYFCYCPLVRQEAVAAVRHISILWETESCKSGCLSYLFGLFIKADELQLKPQIDIYFWPNHCKAELHYRLEICHDRRDRRSCKILASCVNFSRKQRIFCIFRGEV